MHSAVQAMEFTSIFVLESSMYAETATRYRLKIGGIRQSCTPFLSLALGLAKFTRDPKVLTDTRSMLREHGLDKEQLNR
jgi:hypothetical protein